MTRYVAENRGLLEESERKTPVRLSNQDVRPRGNFHRHQALYRTFFKFKLLSTSISFVWLPNRTTRSLFNDSSLFYIVLSQ